LLVVEAIFPCVFPTSRAIAVCRQSELQYFVFRLFPVLSSSIGNQRGLNVTVCRSCRKGEMIDNGCCVQGEMLPLAKKKSSVGQHLAFARKVERSRRKARRSGRSERKGQTRSVFAASDWPVSIWPRPFLADAKLNGLADCQTSTGAKSRRLFLRGCQWWIPTPDCLGPAWRDDPTCVSFWTLILSDDDMSLSTPLASCYNINLRRDAAIKSHPTTHAGARARCEI